MTEAEDAVGFSGSKACAFLGLLFTPGIQRKSECVVWRFIRSKLAGIGGVISGAWNVSVTY